MRTRLQRRLACATTALMMFSSCSAQLEVEHGLRLSTSGKVVVAASLMSTCECATLHNKSEEPIQLVAYHRQIQRGTPLTIDPGKNRQVAFDWAGSDDLDHYELVVHKAGGNPPDSAAAGREAPGPATDKSLGDPVPAVEYLEVVSKPLEVSCDDAPPGSACSPDGPLQLNAVLRRNNSLGGEEHQHGTAGFASDGQTLEVSASAEDPSNVVADPAGNLRNSSGNQKNRCACVVLRSTKPLNLRAFLHGKQIGEAFLDLDQNVPFGFDSAGSYATDYYSLQAIPKSGISYARTTGIGQTSTAPGSTADSRNEFNLRIRDYVSIVGKFDFMECTPNGAIAKVRKGTTSEATGEAQKGNAKKTAGEPQKGNEKKEPEEPAITLVCPFTLHMNKATRTPGTGESAAPNANGTSGAGPR